MKRIANKGFTLIEVLVFVSITSLLLLAAVNITAISISRLKAEQYKVLGNYFMDSLFEWLAGEKERDWTNFYSKASSDGITYCFNQLDIDWPSSAGGCGDEFSLGVSEIFNGKNIFQREATLTTVGEDVKATIVVRWKYKGSTREVKGVRTFSFIER